MNTNKSPRELALDLLVRSTTRVQVAAVLSDRHGIFSWGWNHGDGNRGVHAEEHAFGRANKKRLAGARLTVAGRWRTGRFVYARPCAWRDDSDAACIELARKYGIKTIEYTTRNGDWEIVRFPPIQN